MSGAVLYVHRRSQGAARRRRSRIPNKPSSDQEERKKERREEKKESHLHELILPAAQPHAHPMVELHIPVDARDRVRGTGPARCRSGASRPCPAAPSCALTRSTETASIATGSQDARMPISGTMGASLFGQQSHAGLICIRKLRKTDFSALPFSAPAACSAIFFWKWSAFLIPLHLHGPFGTDQDAFAAADAFVAFDHRMYAPFGCGTFRSRGTSIPAVLPEDEWRPRGRN